MRRSTAYPETRSKTRILKRASGLFIAFALAFAAASIFPAPVFAAGAPETVGSLIAKESSGVLEWQRIRLEDRIQERVKQAVSPTVPRNAFVVNVKIELKPPVKAVIDDTAAKKKAAAKAAAEAAKEKRHAELARAAKGGAGADDRITLSKLDLDAPLFPEEAIDAKPVDDDDDDSDVKVETMPEPDLFANIAKVSIGILYDKSMPDSKKDIIQRIAASSVGTFGEVTPEITVDKVDLLPPVPPEKKFEFPPERPEKPWDFKRWLVEFKTPLGLFLASVVVAGLMVFIVAFVFLGYRGLESRKIALLEAKNAREEAAAQAVAQAAEEERSKGEEDLSVAHGDATSAGLAGPGGAAGAGTGAFDKFKALLKESPERAAALVKQWTKAPGRGSGDALASLPAILSTEEFVQIFKFLSAEDRQSWKKVLSSRAEAPDVAVAEAFIASQIVDNFLVALPPMDEELKGLLGNITVEEASDLAAADPRIGAMLATLLPTNQVSGMYTRLEAEKANAVTLASLKLSDEEIRKNFAALKSAIARAKGKKNRIPFLDKAVELLAGIDPAKEPVIFNAIAESGDWNLLETAARLFFPSELIPRLPDRVLKACLEQLPLIKRAELIASLDDETRATFVGAVGKEGSKARELIDVEIQELSADEGKRRRLTKNRDQIWRSFTDTVRGAVRSSETIADLAGPVMDAWLAEKSGGKIGVASDSQAA